MSAAKFNQKLIDSGYLEERERPSSKGNGTKKFKALTESGLKYGENAISPHSLFVNIGTFFEKIGVGNFPLIKVFSLPKFGGVKYFQVFKREEDRNNDYNTYKIGGGF